MIFQQSLTDFDSFVRSTGKERLKAKTIFQSLLIQVACGLFLYGACLSAVIADQLPSSETANIAVRNEPYSHSGVYFIDNANVEKFKLRKSGSKQPLVKALPVILPPQWQAKIKANIDPQIVVSWQAGNDFVRVLKKIAKRNNLAVIIDWQQKKLLIKKPDVLQVANNSDNKLTVGALPASSIVTELPSAAPVDKSAGVKTDSFLRFNPTNSVEPPKSVDAHPFFGIGGFFSQLFTAEESDSSLNNSTVAANTQTQPVIPQVANQVSETKKIDNSDSAQVATAPAQTATAEIINSDLRKSAVAAVSNVYVLKTGQQLSEALRDWCKLAHYETGSEWNLIWEAANDQPIEANSYYGDNIEAALEQLQVTIIGNNIPLRVYHWSNHVIKVTN